MTADNLHRDRARFRGHLLRGTFGTEVTPTGTSHIAGQNRQGGRTRDRPRLDIPEQTFQCRGTDYLSRFILNIRRQSLVIGRCIQRLPERGKNRTFQLFNMFFSGSHAYKDTFFRNESQCTVMDLDMQSAGPTFATSKAVQTFMFCATKILYLCHAYGNTYVT